MYSDQEFKEWKEELEERSTKLEFKRKKFETEKEGLIQSVRSHLKDISDNIETQIEALEKGNLFNEEGPINFVGDSDSINIDGYIKEAVEELNDFLDEAWEIEHGRRSLKEDKEEYEDELKGSQRHRHAVRQAMSRI